MSQLPRGQIISCTVRVNFFVEIDSLWESGWRL